MILARRRPERTMRAMQRICPEKNTSDGVWIDIAWNRATEKISRMSHRIRDGFPHVAKNGRYDNAAIDWWTNGFWPGILWLTYRDKPDESLRAFAESCELKMEQAIWEFDNLHHDVGFMWSLTSVARYKLLRAEDSRRYGLIAASLLASRFNLRGNFIRAWNEDKAWTGQKAGWAIVDSLMNLPLLYWASECLGDPRFRYIAMAHADTALRHFIRPDGSCRHIVSFDPGTGNFIEALAGQGFSPNSAWSRGQSWALYGMALSYKYTGEARYLEGAERTARFFIEHLPPDGVPPWDFRVADLPDRPRDSSAGACAASGLLELANLAPPIRAAYYRDAGTALIRALHTICSVQNGHEGLLGLGTGDCPRGVNVHVSLIYGDYFFLEGLAKLRGCTDLFW
jgi:unsaturated chondroitin disaccharide hydrolase